MQRSSIFTSAACGLCRLADDIESESIDDVACDFIARSGLGHPSVQDGTDIIGPASEATTPKVSEKDVPLDGFKVTIEIGADVYDSVQYRAIRAIFLISANIPLFLGMAYFDKISMNEKSIVFIDFWGRITVYSCWVLCYEAYRSYVGADVANKEV